MRVSAFTFTCVFRHGNIRLRVAIVSPPWFDLPLMEQSPLLAKEEILSRQGIVGMRRESSESDQVDDDERQRLEAVCEGPENRCVRQNAQDCMLRTVTVARFRIDELFAEHSRRGISRLISALL